MVRLTHRSQVTFNLWNGRAFALSLFALKSGRSMTISEPCRLESKMAHTLVAAGGKNAEEEDLVLSGISLGLMRRFPVRELRWCIESLSVQDKMTGKPKNLLQKCKGSCVPGDMVALMGPSGVIRSPFNTLSCLTP